MARLFVLFWVLLIPVCAGAILGDLNRDGQVNFDDFFILADNFGKTGPPDIPPDTVRVVRTDTVYTVHVDHDTVYVHDLLTTARIAFYSKRDGNGEIYLVNRDGTGVENLTNYPAAEDGFGFDRQEFNWSPDGNSIVFISYEATRGDLFEINRDGSGRTNVTNNRANEWGPVWSPDGTRIAFTSNRDFGSDLYIMNPDGTDVRRLTKDENVNFSEPTWFPDNTRLLVTGLDLLTFQAGLYVASIDGSVTPNLITPHGGEGSFGSVSPDGSQIAFSRDQQVYVMNADGTGLEQLTDFPDNRHVVQDTSGTYVSGSSTSYPFWSPDGKYILTETVGGGIDGIYVVNVSTREASLLANGSHPTWSPDGSEIAFDAYDGNDYEIFVAQRDGGYLLRLTINDSDDRLPKWAP